MAVPYATVLATAGGFVAGAVATGGVTTVELSGGGLTKGLFGARNPAEERRDAAIVACEWAAVGAGLLYGGYRLGGTKRNGLGRGLMLGAIVPGLLLSLMAAEVVAPGSTRFPDPKV